MEQQVNHDCEIQRLYSHGTIELHPPHQQYRYLHLPRAETVVEQRPNRKVETTACISRDVRGWFVDRRGQYTLLLHRDLQRLEATENLPRIVFPSVSQGLLMLSLTRGSTLSSLGRWRPREVFRRL